MNTIKTIDLFAGVGGLRMGFELAGFDTVYANDFDSKCKITYDLNFKVTKLTLKDITKPTTTDSLSVLDDVLNLQYDVLLGGFPCQAFSIAGYRQGFRDTKGRGDLFFYLAEIIEKTNPNAFLLENVKNLKNHDNGKTYSIIKKSLKNMGYFVTERVLNSAEYGNVPQNRERIYIVGFKQESQFNKFSFPDPIKREKEIIDVLDKNVDKQFYYNEKPIWERLKSVDFTENSAYQWRRIYIRQNKSGVFPTLTANMGMGGHNVPIIKDSHGVRKITPRECFRIQGFPDAFQLPNIAQSHLYKQAGNSVSVPVVNRIAQQMLVALQ